MINLRDGLTLEVMADYVRKYPKGIGLRLIYNRFGVPNETKPHIKKLWDQVADELNIHKPCGRGKKKNAETKEERKET